MADQPRRKGPWETRREHVSPSDLRDYAAQLVALATKLEEHADTIEEAGRRSVYVDGAKKFANGYTQVDTFVKNVNKAMIDEGI